MSLRRNYKQIFELPPLFIIFSLNPTSSEPNQSLNISFVSMKLAAIEQPRMVVVVLWTARYCTPLPLFNRFINVRRDTSRLSATGLPQCLSFSLVPMASSLFLGYISNQKHSQLLVKEDRVVIISQSSIDFAPLYSLVSIKSILSRYPSQSFFSFFSLVVVSPRLVVPNYSNFRDIRLFHFQYELKNFIVFTCD